MQETVVPQESRWREPARAVMRELKSVWVALGVLSGAVLIGFTGGQLLGEQAALPRTVEAHGKELSIHGKELNAVKDSLKELRVEFRQAEATWRQELRDVAEKQDRTLCYVQALNDERRVGECVR